MEFTITSVKACLDANSNEIPGKFRIGFEKINKEGVPTKYCISQYRKDAPKPGEKLVLNLKYDVEIRTYEGRTYKELVSAE